MTEESEGASSEAEESKVDQTQGEIGGDEEYGEEA